MTKLIFALALGSACLIAADKPVKLQDLPAPVQKTVAAEKAKGAELKGFSAETENGKTTYEIETIVGGKTRDLLVDKAGKIVVVEEEMTLDGIPAAAKAAFEKKAGSGKITKVEKVIKGDSITYEAVISKGGKNSELMVNADGTPAK